MKNLFFIAMATMTLAVACDSKKTTPTPETVNSIVVVREMVDSMQKEYEMDTIKKVKHGYFKIFHTNGKVALEQRYVNDTVDGTEKIYYSNGQLEGEFGVVKGKYHGPFKYYFPDGKLKQEGQHKNDAVEGELKTYHPNGNLKEIATMVNSVADGPFQDYYENGKLKGKGQFIYVQGDGQTIASGSKEHCLLETYDEKTGALATKMICRSGQCCTIWTAEKGDVKPSSPLCAEIVKEMKAQCNVTVPEGPKSSK